MYFLIDVAQCAPVWPARMEADGAQPPALRHTCAETCVCTSYLAIPAAVASKALPFRVVDSEHRPTLYIIDFAHSEVETGTRNDVRSNGGMQRT